LARFAFWFSAAFVLFTYFGYPALLALWAGLRPRPVRKSPFAPFVSIVISVHNGADYLQRKLKNLLVEMDYPADRFEIILVSDGSTDATAEVARGFADSHLRFFELPQRKGKPSALNLAVAQARGEIVIFNDMRQTMAPDALRQLVANFNDPAVGGVTGEMVLVDPHDRFRPQYGLYYRYEQWIRLKESAIGSMIGSSGAFSAIRRELFRTLPPDVILDDVYTPMQIVLRGYRTVFDPSAHAFDPHDERSEFLRKQRTLMGNYQILFLLPAILSPRNPLLLPYLFHKIFRLIVPYFLVTALVANLLVHTGFYAITLTAQLAFYLAALGAQWLRKLPAIGTLASSGSVFVQANFAALLGLFFFVRRKRDIWV
jgi:poly-beta-1,6-N-acetyl-D-glucosamine synthase